MLDQIASARLRAPSLWELAAWRGAAKADRRVWEDAFDGARFCYAAEDALRVLELELRRERSIRCGAPAIAAGCVGVPVELTRHEFYAARNFYSWMRADVRAEAASKVTTFSDKVLLVSEGAVAANARSAISSHAFTQASSVKQVAAIGTSALYGNREAALFTGAQSYISTMTTADWQSFLSGNFSMMCLLHRAIDTAIIVCGAGGGGVHGYMWINKVSAGDIGFSANGGGGISSAGGLLVSGGPPRFVQVEHLAAGEAVAGYLSGSSVYSGALGMGTLGWPGCLGAGANGGTSAYLNGGLSDLILSKAPSAALRAMVVRYGLLRYGIT
jgi:hypothetical protein